LWSGVGGLDGQTDRNIIFSMKTVGRNLRIATAVVVVLVAWSAASAALPKRSMVTYAHAGGCIWMSSYALRATQIGDSATVEVITDRLPPGRADTFRSRIPVDVYAMVWDSLVKTGFFSTALLPSYEGKVTRTGMQSGYISMEYDSGGITKAKRVGFHSEPTSPPEFVTVQRLASSFDPWARTTIEQFRHGDFLKALEALGRTFDVWPDGRKVSPQCEYIVRTGKAPELVRMIFDHLDKDTSTKPVLTPNGVLMYLATRAAPAVLRELRNASPAVRSTAVGIVRRMPSAKSLARYLLPLLRDSSDRVRNEVATVLALQGRKEPATVLMRWFLAEGDSSRWSSVNIPGLLVRIESKEGVDLILRWAEAKPPKTTLRVVGALAEVRDPRVTDVYRKITEAGLADSGEWLRPMVCVIGYRPSDTILLGWVSSRLLSDTSSSLLADGAADLVRLSQWTRTAPLLRTLFVSRNRNPAVLQALGDVRDTTFYDSFRFYSANSDAGRRTAAVAALARFDDAESRRLRLVALNRSDVTPGIAASFETQPDPNARDRLVDLLRSSDWLVRKAATKALGKLGDPSVVPDLRSSVAEDENDYVKEDALRVIKLLERRRGCRLFHR
jgi:HEAT repeat protein